MGLENTYQRDERLNDSFLRTPVFSAGRFVSPVGFRDISDLYSFSRGNIYVVQEKRYFHFFFLPN